MREINKQRGIFSDKIDVKDEKDYVNHVVNELTEEINERNAFGMCAPQLGYFARIVCLKVQDKVQEFINPVLRRTGDEICFVAEKSLSLEDENQEYLVARPKEIDIYYQDKKGLMHGCTLKDVASTTFMQLYDILVGVFVDDLYEKKPDNFDEMTIEEQEAYLTEYADRLKNNEEAIDKEINDDPELEDIKGKLEAYKMLSLAELKSRTESKNDLNRKERRGLQRALDRKLKGRKTKK